MKILNEICNLPYLDLETEILPNEFFLDIYGGYYSVSNLGRVRSNDRLDTKGRKLKGKFRKQCIKHTHIDYKKRKTDTKELVVCLCFDGNKKTHHIRVLVGELFVGSKNKHQCYSVKNGVWNDNRAENIEIKTFSDSLKQAYSNGRKKRTTKFVYKNMNTGEKFTKTQLQNHEFYSYVSVVSSAKNKIKMYGVEWRKIKDKTKNT